MRTVIAFEYITLDGVMEAPEKWQFAYFTDDVADFIKKQILEPDTILLGRVTYDILAASWPSRTHNEFGIADKLNSVRKVVISTTLERAEWNNSALIRGDVAEAIARLKQEPGGNIAIIGSGELVKTLMHQDLIDEYRLMVHPVVLGSGKRLFANGVRASLRFVETKAFSSGVVMLRYQLDRAQ